MVKSLVNWKKVCYNYLNFDLGGEMEENIFYFSAKESVDEFIVCEYLDFPKKLQNQLINFLPNMGNYV